MKSKSRNRKQEGSPLDRLVSPRRSNHDGASRADNGAGGRSGRRSNRTHPGWAGRGDWDDNFGRLLKETREQEGLTQAELAKAAGLTAMHVSHFECGRRMPCLRTFRELMFVLGDYCESLLGLEHAGVSR